MREGSVSKSTNIARAPSADRHREYGSVTSTTSTFCVAKWNTLSLHMRLKWKSAPTC